MARKAGLGSLMPNTFVAPNEAAYQFAMQQGQNVMRNPMPYLDYGATPPDALEPLRQLFYRLNGFGQTPNQKVMGR